MNSPLPKSRLGRGLASLIGESPQAQPRMPVEGEQRTLPLAQIRSSRFNPRKDFPEADLAELAESIRTKGLVQPIVVRPHPEDAQAYEIVAGERRWRASQKAGLHNIPVIVRDLSDREVLELAIIENVQRADLNAIEEANGYRELIERFDYSQEQVSEIIGKSRSHVANTLRLLRLPDSVQIFVQEGKLTAGHARALVGREDAEALAKQILEQDLNVREAEALVQTGGPIGTPGSTGARKLRDKDADTKAFEKELADSLGLKVEVKRGSGESGNLVIKYGNFDQLDYIRLRLMGANGG
ncbi:ParB/RepB/Spo0J family partition protein [Hyphomicrobium sp. LHD-15]|uniref:ParB/RepB/Spo0J family partition protein n=1 Tax=Hyphomicrobium sp. LHD-15 TaxID=3072142 RepID=UPI00280FD5DA|nr:ParB/RepB/Spo0J family partition protein [Hyphomicrobium sp. LHD-15]MDQ8698599.1 ParB/RepB/Spo0J family partition protein [Hyphomicrobium sp. LHD-15]